MKDSENKLGPARTYHRQQPAQPLGFRHYLRTLWRRKFAIALSMFVGLSIAFLVGSQIIPLYEAESQLVLDARNTTILKFDAVVSGLPPQLEVLRTEMDVIGSRGMAERVLDHLSPADVKELADDGARTTPMSKFFKQTWPGMVARAIDWLPLLKRFIAFLPSEQYNSLPDTAPSSAAVSREYLVNLILQGLKISNDGRSYTIHIAFASPHPDLAAAIANTYATQYPANQLDMKAGATTRANELLSQRLVELRRQLEQSETAVETYRRAAGVLGDKDGTIVTQQISQTTADLAIARSQRIEAESRLRAVRAQIGNGGDLQALSDVLSSQTVQLLRAKQAELKRQQAELKSQYTANYPNAKNIETDIATVQAQIADEVARVVSSLAIQVDVARNREASVQQNLANLERQFGQGSEAEVKLQQLQREADANLSVYETYLNRLKEITEQQQLNTPDAHIVSLATQPTVPTYPRYQPMLALGWVMGGIVGVGIALWREASDQRLRSIGQVEEATGIPVVALMPSLSWRYLGRPEEYVLRPGRHNSQFNEALRSTWAAILLARDPLHRIPAARQAAAGIPTRQSRRALSEGRVVLVTSSVPNEGKTSFCLSIARSLAKDGHRVLLIDGDLRRPGVARSLDGTRNGRMADLLEGKIELQEAVQVDQRSGTHYLATQRASRHPQDVLNCVRMETVLEEARRNYDIILIDTPPILVAADAAIMAELADRCLFFIRWGKTSRDLVVSALRRLELYDVQASGIVLSHVNLRRHAQYAAGEGYYRSYGKTPRLPPMLSA
jgi:succinoglycan biosynthesis transport protein ExoP